MAQVNYVSVEGLSKSYGIKTLFEDLSFGINEGQKIALIAQNGTGKTTLLRILAGQEKADKGTVAFRKELTVGILEQEPNIDPKLSVEEAMFQTNDERLTVVRKYKKAILEEDEAEKMQALMEEMDRLNAWDIEAKVAQVLSHLKLENLDQKVETLSGGQKRRLALAQLLISAPDLMILDEPTNHLDLQMIKWLENYLSSDNITLFLVTHDRYFLDNVCNEILELEGSELHKYKGNYSYFLEKQADRKANEQAVVSKAKNLMRKELDWMRRQPKARGTKSKARIDAFHDLKSTASRKLDDKQVDLEIKSERLGSKIVELHKVSKSFPKLKIINQFTYQMKKGERIGLVGPNGVGKSTLLNMIIGKEEPDAGKVVIGETVQFGYYSQKGLQLNDDMRVIDLVKDKAEVIPLAKGRKITASKLLERFLFDKEKQWHYVSTLSGGEKKRLLLCTLLMENPNFLILDEPTNDLDIVTIQVLEDFLQQFQGCLLIVSHDRFFMDKTIDQLWLMEGDGEMRTFPGNYSDYLDHQEVEKAAKKEAQKVKEVKTNKPVQTDKVKLSYNDKKDWQNIPKELEKLEAKKIQIESRFTSEDLDQDQIQELSAQLQEILDEIEMKELRWLEIDEKMQAQ